MEENKVNPMRSKWYWTATYEIKSITTYVWCTSMDEITRYMNTVMKINQ